MATKAENFRYESERSGPKQPKKAKPPKGRVISQGTNEEGVATKRHGEGHVKTAANLTLRATVTTRSPSERAHRGRSPSRGVAPSR